MSIDLSVYVGPYLECRVERVLAIETRMGCPDPSCKRHGVHEGSGANRARFCRECGKPIGEAASEAIKPRVDRWDAAEAIRDALTHENCGSKDFLYWVPNIHRDPPRDFNIWKDQATDFYGTGLDIKESLWFDAAFAPEIAKLRELYGESNVRVCWGVVAYTS